jgi:hypothetical protein
MTIDQLIQYIIYDPDIFWIKDSRSSTSIINEFSLKKTSIDLVLHIKFDDLEIIHLELHPIKNTITTRIFICGLEFVCVNHPKGDIVRVCHDN